ncbi:hypothetical protein FYJ55_00065 [Holdemanella biformis]|uniref:Ig-like domain-containing protein n=1 Tax=Holdemanella porci TaxID=2652276 RepID=A0A6N7VEF7_9FIRM|nr:hypothetical protein [Holdemanella porci]MSS55342.1 hypothetical protein [Holdemanella porci]
MKKLLGVLLALFMFCIPMGIQADEEVLSFEYTGHQIEIKGAFAYYLLDDGIHVSEAPMDCGRYRAIYSDGSNIEYEITPKVVHVKVKYNKDWRPGDPEENRYLCEYDGDYEFILSSYVNGDFKTDYDDNYKFEFEPKNKKDVEIVKTTITHPDVEYVYTGSDIVIDSKVDSISPISFKNVGEYIVSFNVDSNYYESIPFKVTILPKTVHLRLNKYQKYVGEKDPVLETDDYILTREVGEGVGNYKLTVKSKSRNYKYEIIENDIFTILENKLQQIKPEVTNHPSNDEKKEPLHSVNTSNKDKIKHAGASDKNTSINIETKANKESAKTEAKVVTGVSNLTSMYYLSMISSIAVIMYILIKKKNVKS